MGKKKSPNFVFDVSCGQCASFRFRYNKGSSGALLRCFIGNISAPQELVALKSATGKDELGNLRCLSCEELMAVPMVYKDGRLAYRMITGGFSKKKVK